MAAGALVPVDPARCPDCTTPVAVTTTAQGALLRHGGYGAALQVTWRWCPCGYVLAHETTEVRPWR